MTAQERAAAAFVADHGRPAEFMVRAPGRVNLIGEHTDYNDGFVLPMALPFEAVIACRPVDDDVVRVRSEGFGSLSFSMADDPADTAPWGRYLHGMAAMLRDTGRPCRAWEGVISTDIPAGASLSSSAALEVAAGLAFTHAAGASIDPTAVALLGQRVENEIFGLPSGIMDQLASAASVAGCASLIDCRDLSVRSVELPDDVAVVVMDTGTRRELVDSEYQDRQQTCMRVAEVLGVEALRDASLEDLDRLDAADDVGRRRAGHVISENARTLAAADAAAAGDMTEFGRLMNESHDSLRDRYEVSGPALDAMVDLARATPGCLGARMTGGGFAGGTVALVPADRAEAFSAAVTASYRAPDEQPATEPHRLYTVRPVAGASVLT